MGRKLSTGERLHEFADELRIHFTACATIALKRAADNGSIREREQLASTRRVEAAADEQSCVRHSGAYFAQARRIGPAPGRGAGDNERICKTAVPHVARG